MYAAIDLGAGSGRAFLGRVTSHGLALDEVHRFTYAPRLADGHLRWDVARLFEGLRTGLEAARRAAVDLGGRVRSVGVDAWGVDYGLVDAGGDLVEEPIAYRDARTDGVMDAVCARLGRDAIFARTGIQFMPINTIYQLVAHVRDGLSPAADGVLMMPDICHLFLSGERSGEYTNASTTQLLDARARAWADPLFETLGLPRALMPSIAAPGTDIGPLRPGLQAELGGTPIRVIVPATHDTASAVVGTPLRPGWAFVSSGTWSLVGVERLAPILGADACAANFTNEGGAGGTIRLLRNVMGLWLIEACRREWAHAAPDHEALVAGAAGHDGHAGLIDVDDLALLNPPSMVAAVRSQLASTGQTMPATHAGVARLIFDSLAVGYARVVASIERLTGEPIPGVHVVGGGSRNAYLNQATADATGKPVIAGPVEATAAGNAIVQAIAAGALSSIADGREQLARAIAVKRYEPSRSSPLREMALLFEDNSKLQTPNSKRAQPGFEV